MIQKLQRKLIAIATVCMLGVMLLLVGVINGVNYYNMNHSTSELLQLLAQNEGNMPLYRQGNKERDESLGSLTRQLDAMTPETKFKTRYFYVTMSSDGDIAEINTDHIAAVTQDEAENLTWTVQKLDKISGFVGIYKYLRTPVDDGEMYIFLDCQSEINNVKRVLIITVATTLGSVTLMFLLVLFFTRIAIQPAVKSMEKQKQFITDAGHELKTPLSIIRSNAELMQMEDGQSEWLDSICNQVDRMQQMVSHLITLSRLNEEDCALPSARFSLSDAVYDTASAFSGLAHQQQKQFTTEIAPDIIYKGDEGTIRKLLSALIDNAVKYCDEGGSISIRLTRGPHPVLTVENTYAQVQQLELDRLFDRFYRADASRARKTGGYGLGLAMARSIAQRHHARLTAEARDKALALVVYF